MSRYCYQNTLTEFLREDRSSWLETMKTSFSELSQLPLSPSQVNAWKDCFDVLQRELPKFDKVHPGFSIIFEYMLPYESGRRPDVILLSEEQVLILEFKMKTTGEQADVDQCKAYGRDIRNYHFESRDKEVLDALVLTRTSGKLARNRYTKTPVISGDALGDYLEKVVAPTTTPTDVEAWCESSYEPLPTIVEAAKKFMNDEPLPRIRRVNSTGIPSAIECLTKISKEAEENNEHVIVYTGRSEHCARSNRATLPLTLPVC